MGSIIKILSSIVLIITANVVNASPRNVGTFKEIPRCVMSKISVILFDFFFNIHYFPIGLMIFVMKLITK